MNNFNIVNTNPDSVTTAMKKVQLTEVLTNLYKKSPVSCNIIKFR
jgi:hypothetical protein